MPSGSPAAVAPAPHLPSLEPEAVDFLLTNDDGIDGPGIHASERLLSRLGTCTVVAPKDQLSGCGHQATHRRPIGVLERSIRHFEVDGFPVDCVRLGLTQLATNANWVISGINPGGNLGADVYMSGTVAAAREATFLGRRAIAISALLTKDYAIDWDRLIHHLEPILKDLLARPLEAQHFWNLNLPCLPAEDRPLEVVEVQTDTRAMDVRYERGPEGFEWLGVYRERPRTPGFDFDVCMRGQVALAKIRL